MWFKKKLVDKVLVRVCIGSILPSYANLIGKGTYTHLSPKGKVTEQYYDYEINEDDLDGFLSLNSSLLIKYGLLDIDEKVDETKKEGTVKPTSVRGWAKKDYK